MAPTESRSTLEKGFGMAELRKRLSLLLQADEFFPLMTYLPKWLFICLLVGFAVGTASALFLISLDYITNFREEEIWPFLLLPLMGLLIGIVYHRYGQAVSKGNNQILDELYAPKGIIPFRMAPLVLFGTLATHFVGGSAGREGTAVQVGSAIADRFTKAFKLSAADRRIILICGISAGFASVFGTPLAGAVFALEVLLVGRMRYEAILPSFLAAVIADYACLQWGAHHTHYNIPLVPDLDLYLLFITLALGAAFGLCARLFSFSVQRFSSLFQSLISYPPLRPFIGGIILVGVFWLIGTRYAGLGIPVITESFEIAAMPQDFLLKIILTAFTLSAGFKGGEVTPLFFIGATLGSALSLFVPMPIGLLAGMGFVAVFAGATNTPIACTLMGIELFGSEAGVFLAIACVTAYLFSGHTGIYSSQIIGSPKHLLFGSLKGKSLDHVRKK
jgi:H+/Cl- antiporter ClcA